MKILCLLAAGLLFFSTLVIVNFVTKTLADRTVRRGWWLSALVTGLVACVQLYFCFFGKESVSALAINAAFVMLSAVLVINAFLLRKTIEYVKEISTINGIDLHDPVSGVFNRIYLEQRLDTEVARSHRYGSPLGVVSVEIKDFIQLNDEYGHQGSAIATTKIARRLKFLLRETDVVASFSAGRFILVLPDTPEGSLSGLISRLRSAIDGLVVIDGAGIEKSVEVNVIFGSSHCELKTRNGHELIHKAFASASQESPYKYLTEPVANQEYYRQTYNESKALP